MGSAAGAVMGGAYLAAAGVHGAPQRQPALTATAPASPVAVPARLLGPPPAAQAAVEATAPVVAARPFHFADVASGATDLQCLTEAVYFEARGEPVQGQKAVAQVVLNRVRHPAFPKTVCGVVHQRSEAGCQFSFACAVEPRGRDESAWNRARTVAQAALHGAVMRQIGDATHFESVRAAAFAGLLKVARIGEHVFYRFGGRNGAAGMFHQTPDPSVAPRILVASLEGRAAPSASVALDASAPPPEAVAPRVTIKTVAMARAGVVAGAGGAVGAPPAAAVPAAVTLVPASTVSPSPVGKAAAASPAVAS